MTLQDALDGVEFSSSDRLNYLVACKSNSELMDVADLVHTNDSSNYETFKEGIALARYAGDRPIYSVLPSPNSQYWYWFVGTFAEIEAKIKGLPDDPDVICPYD